MCYFRSQSQDAVTCFGAQWLRQENRSSAPFKETNKYVHAADFTCAGTQLMSLLLCTLGDRQYSPPWPLLFNSQENPPHNNFI